MGKNYDVVIIGAGIMGVICAYCLAGAGKSVLVLERKDSCAGAGGGTNGVISWYTKKPGFHRQMFMRSWEDFRELENELGDIGMVWNEGIVQLAENEFEMENVRQTYAEAEIPEGFSMEVLDGRQTLEVEPNVRPDILGSLFVPDTGFVDMFTYIFRVLAAAKARGAEVLNEVEVTGLIRKEDRILGVHTSRGDFFCETVVNCAGYYGGQVAAMAGLELPILPRRGQTVVCQQTLPIIFHHIASSLYNIIKFHPELIKDEKIRKLGVNCTLQQTRDGSIYINGSREMAGYDRRTENETIRLIIEGGIQRVPCLKDVLVLRTFAGLRPYTADGLPMVGAVDGLEGFFMCAGHEGDGVALSPVTGEIVCDLLTKGYTEAVDVQPLSPMRFLK